MKRLFYCGDVAIEHGGYFYSLETYKWGYVEVMRCVPVSDAGGPDNMFWIEELTLNIPKPGTPRFEELRKSYYDDDKSFNHKNRHMMVQAAESYGLYDQESVVCIQIGPKCPFTSHREAPTPHRRLRASVNLYKLVRKMALGHDLLNCVKPL